MKARMWSEFRKARTINTGDGFVTVTEDDIVIIIVARPNEPVMKTFAELAGKMEPLPVEEA